MKVHAGLGVEWQKGDVQGDPFFPTYLYTSFAHLQTYHQPSQRIEKSSELGPYPGVQPWRR